MLTNSRKEEKYMKMYPLKFQPAFKDYIWGGRSFEALGKKIPDGIVAESWEISTHPDGLCTIINGEFAGMTLDKAVKTYGREIVGNSLPDKDVEKFPLLVKFIDANQKLSVQVHPEDDYAFTNESGELGKNEMWYILSAKPGAKLIYDVNQGVTREKFSNSVKEGEIESCLKYIDVVKGDTLNIPAGLVHAIGEGIVLAEIQQNSNTTYRVYDYDRVDKNGNTRPLHINKALDVIDFENAGRKIKYNGITVKNDNSTITTLVANKYFAVEKLSVSGNITELADGSKFFIYVVTDGSGEISWSDGEIQFAMGESILIPAATGQYTLSGNFEALRSFVPDLEEDVLKPLMKSGFNENDIKANIAGLLSHFHTAAKQQTL
jgi:mannose-6-phosphate isomerase